MNTGNWKGKLWSILEDFEAAERELAEPESVSRLDAHAERLEAVLNALKDFENDAERLIRALWRALPEERREIEEENRQADAWRDREDKAA